SVSGRAQAGVLTAPRRLRAMRLLRMALPPWWMGGTYQDAAAGIKQTLFRRRIGEPSGEQHHVRLPVANEEEERMIGAEHHRLLRRHLRPQEIAIDRDRRRLGAALVDVDERLVHHCADVQLTGAVDTREVGVG